MQLRSPYDVSPSSRDWHGSPVSHRRPGQRVHGHSRAVAMARQHPEELGVVLRLIAVMAFFGLMGTLLFCFGG